MSRHYPDASHDASVRAAAPPAAVHTCQPPSRSSTPPRLASLARSALAFYRRDPAVGSVCVSCAIVPIVAVVPQRLKGPLVVLSLAFLALGAIMMLVRRPRRTSERE